MHATDNQRLTMVDALRGIAAMAVCWNHFTSGDAIAGALKSSGRLGWLGVEVFFVISGFIIPYSLYRSGYRIRNYATFLLKRIIRLDPPYLVTIAVILASGLGLAVLPIARPPNFEFSFAQLALHLGYLNAFFDYRWLNPVFWTLAIEFQYYLLAGLLFFAIADRSLPVRMAAFAALAVLAFVIRDDRWVFHYLFLFMLGMIVFQRRVGLIGLGQFLLMAALLSYGEWRLEGYYIAGVGVATAFLICLYRAGVPALLLWFGQLSYSIYLLHIPIGSKIEWFGLPFADTMAKQMALLAVAVAATLLAAWLLHRYVERPAQRWSSRIRYVRAKVTSC